MKLSVVLVTYNRADLLGRQLEALAAQTFAGSWELIVADNGSTDGTLAVVERYRDRVPDLRVVVATELHGPSYVRNVGVRAATGQAVAFLDDDDEVTPGWLAAIHDGLSRHDAVAARIDWGALNPSWALAARGRPMEAELARWWLGGDELPYAIGGTLGVRLATHRAIGGFDEDIVAGEDVDYSWRLQRAGFELHYLPQAVVCFRARTSLRGIFRQARLWGESDPLIYKKHRAFLPPLSRPVARAATGWAGTLLLFVRARSKADVGVAVRHLGWRVGLVRGSLKYRVLMLSDQPRSAG